MKKIILLGASGTIGQNALKIIGNYPEDFTLTAFSCHKNEDFLRKIKNMFPESFGCLTGKTSDFSDYRGPEGLIQMIRETKADLVLNGIAGSPGLSASWETLKSGKKLALANKETIVMAGHLLSEYLTGPDPQIIPVDSEHSALFFLTLNHSDIKELILTASGGPFLDWSQEEIARATPKDALKHPSWNMGNKITIDSASMANKGLEVIEAHYLFNRTVEEIKVVIHPESIVHSFVRTKDNALYAQMGLPDMALPIQNALFFPEMKPVKSILVDPWELNLHFRKIESEKFPMLTLAYKAVTDGPCSCIAYNAANEVAVDLFQKNRLGFSQIPELTKSVMNRFPVDQITSIEKIIQYNKECLEFSQTLWEEEFASG